MTIGTWIKNSSRKLADEMIASARLDSEIILAHTISKPRTWLHAHTDEQLDDRRRDIADARLELRLQHVPIAYIIGHKDFYGRRFKVTPEVLVPRPESEALIEYFLQFAPKSSPNYRVVDVGTGSGCLGISAKLERPDFSVDLTDTSRYALTLASKNAQTLGAKVHVSKSNLLSDYPYAPDCIIANLPYVDESWQQSPDLAHEPAQALFAANGGLALIYKLIDQAAPRQPVGSLMILEADTRQLDEIIAYSQKSGYKLLQKSDFSLALQRV